MKKLINVAIGVGGLSLILGIISRVLRQPFMFGLKAHAFLSFTNTCLLIAIVLALLQILRKKEE